MAKPSPTEGIALLRSVSLSRLVEQEIERAILEGELAPGDRVNEAAVAERLKVSRGPVREALRGLEGSGLVRSVVNRGVFVREVSLEEALEAYEVRSALLRLVGRKLASAPDPALLGELEALCDRMTAAVEAGDLDAYYPLNVAFHRRLVEAAGNRYLVAIYAGLSKELHLFRRRSLVQPGGMEASYAEHRDILSAIRAGDQEAAGALLERHVTSGMGRLLAVVRPKADAPPVAADAAGEREAS